MGSNVTKKLRKKLCIEINLKCYKSRRMSAKFVDYQSLTIAANSGDIIELVFCQTISHYVLLDRLIDDHYWCFHVQRLPHNKNYGLVRHEPLSNVLRDVFPHTTPVYRVNNQKRLSEKVLQLTQNSVPDVQKVLSQLSQLSNSVVKFDENHCNCEHYVTLWKYGIGWSHAITSQKSIIKTIQIFRKSFAENIFNDICIEITNESISHNNCTVIIHCFGLYGQKLLDAIQYVMHRQRTLIKV